MDSDFEGGFSKAQESHDASLGIISSYFSKTFIVEYDASGHGVSAILLQERPIAYFSQALRGKHLLLSTYEKEILVLALAIQKWRPYLLGKQFIVRTDHQSLKHLWSQKIVTTAQQKWLYKFMGYDFNLENKKGKENVVADALSRSHEQPQGVVFAMSQLLPRWLEVIQEEVAVKPILRDFTLNSLPKQIGTAE